MIIRAVHNRDNPFFMMRRATAQDARLTMEARGVLAYLFSRNDDWTLYEKDLLAQTAEAAIPMGRSTLRRILGELKRHGYLRRVRCQGVGGKFEWDTEIYETPFEGDSDSSEPFETEEKVVTKERETEEKEPQATPTGQEKYPSQPEKAIPMAMETTPESVRLFVEVSGEHLPIYRQEEIVGTVQDLAIWEIVLREWRQGGYGWRSIGRLLTKYSERVRQQLPNTKASNGNGAHVGASTSKPVLEVHRSLSDQEILELADVFKDRPEGERSESETDIINQAARIRAINGNAPTRA